MAAASTAAADVPTRELIAIDGLGNHPLINGSRWVD